MEAIVGLDWGVYAFFQFQANRFPQLTPVFLNLYLLASLPATSAIAAVAVLLFCINRNFRATMSSGLAFVISLSACVALKALVPKRRPEDAVALFPSNDLMRTSYPADSLWLFALSALLLAWSLSQFTKSRAAGVTAFGLAAVLIAVEGLAHLFLRVHFLTDILAGLCGGLALALIAWQASLPNASAAPATPSLAPRGEL